MIGSPLRKHWLPLVLLMAAPLVADQPTALQAPPIENATRILDTKTREIVTLRTLLERLTDAEVIFLGEAHHDETTHRFQWRMYQELILASEGKVVLSMEMFERDVQSVLDDYLAGRIPESDFLKTSRPWANYRTDQRPMIELAKARSLPVVAANFPAPIRRAMMFGGKEAYEKLSEEDRRWTPRELYPNSEAYWDRFVRAIRGHGHFFAALGDSEARLYSAQCLWDNAMGEACVDALAAHPGSKVLHLNGGFHTAYRQGTAAQVKHRRPDTNIVVVDIRPVSSLSLIGVDVDWDELAEVADFMVYAEELARGVGASRDAVAMKTELEFDFFVPERATDAAPVPLLIWMGRSGLRAADVMSYLRLAFGDEVAIVAVEPPFPIRGEDLYLSGEWYFEERFADDVPMLSRGLARLVSRVFRTQPIDPMRVVLVGEEAAGTVVASTMLYGRDAMPLRAFSVSPKRFHKLRDGGLPAPREAGALRYPFDYSDLVVYTDPDDVGFWETELVDYAKTGLRVERRDVPDSPLIEVESAVRRALGLPDLPELTGDARVLITRIDTPLARFWADIEVRAFRRQGIKTIVQKHASGGPAPLGAEWLAVQGEYGATPELGLTPSSVGEFKILPRTPSPFGGTTVIVTYPSTTTEMRDAWMAIEAADPIAKRSRFSRLRVAHIDASPTIHEVLQSIRESGGQSVLLVPAAFCASPEEMRALRDAVTDHVQGLDVYWLPGLGGRAYHRHDREDSKSKESETR